MGIFAWGMRDNAAPKSAQTPKTKSAVETPAPVGPNPPPTTFGASKTEKTERPAQPESRPATPTDLPPTRDSLAQKAFDKATAFKGLTPGDKAGRIKVLEEFLQSYGDTIPAARAKSMIDQLKGPAEKSPAATASSAKQINDANTAFAKGVESANKGDFESALSFYNRALELHPTPEAFCNRGNAKRGLTDLDGALADMDKSIELNGNLWQSHANRAIILLALGRADDANSSIQKARSLHNQPDGLETWIRQNGKSSAIINMGKNLEGKTPALAADFEARAQYRILVKKYDEAKSDLVEALRLQPEDGPKGIFNLLIQIADKRQDWKAKLENARLWAEAAPKSPEALNAHAWELLTSKDNSLRDPKAALPLAQKASELANNASAPILDTLALALFHNGKKQDAIEAERKALGLLPANASPEAKKEYEDRLKDMESIQ